MPALLRALALVAALALLAVAPATASAATQTINGTPLDVTLTDVGNMQAVFDNEAFGSTSGFFYGSHSSGFNLRFASGPRAGVTFGNRTTAFTPVSNGPISGDGTVASPLTNVTVYKVPDGAGGEVAEVRQTARYVHGDSRYRMTYEVTNRSDAALRFRAATAGDLYVDGDDSGVGVLIDASPRFVGGTNTNSRITGGAQEVRSSRLPTDAAPVAVAPWAGYEVNGFSTVYSRLSQDAGFTGHIEGSRVDNGVGVEWEDHLAEDAGLAPGATARYEVVWVVRQALPLTLSPPVAVPEVGSAHVVTAALRTSEDQPRPGVTLRYAITGANPTAEQAIVTGDGGGAEIRWTGAAEGEDRLTVYADYDGDGTRDDDEPVQTATANWRAQSDVDPPTAGQISTPSGDPVRVSAQASPDDPTRVYFSIANSQANQFEACPDGGRRLNLPIGVPIQPGSGAVVEGSVSLLMVDPVSDDVTRPIRTIPFAGAAPGDGVYGFTVECVSRADLYVRYTLEEGGARQVFTVPIGGLVLIDPQGVVYDGERYDAAIAAGNSEAQARAAAAIQGATVRLQRRVDGEFRNVLSGDPGIAPNVNPQVTGTDGLYQWDVSAGAYRVVVTANGYPMVESRSVDIPPPVLDLHIRMDRPRSDPPGGGGGSAGGGGGGSAAGGGGQAQPLPTPAPILVPAVQLQKLKLFLPATTEGDITVRRNGTTRGELANSNEFPLDVRLVWRRVGGRNEKLMDETIRLAPEEVRAMTLRLTERGHKLARRLGLLKAEQVVTISGGGETISERRSFSLRSPKRGYAYLQTRGPRAGESYNLRTRGLHIYRVYADGDRVRRS